MMKPMKTYYECHVTFLLPSDAPTPLLTGWAFSSIDGDPVLGKGVKSYFTRQFRDSVSLEHVIWEVEVVAGVLREMGLKVLRTKVEHVVYDSKTIPEALFQ